MTRFPARFSLALTVLTIATAQVSLGHDDLSQPVITTETKKDADGKDVPYMYIDGIKVHETDVTKQPAPPVVTPGSPAAFFAPPSDAIVLFDGSDNALTENWTDTKGAPSGWKVIDGALESVKKAGYIQTKKSFGSSSFMSNGPPRPNRKVTARAAATAACSS